jgi:hypothetical protein
MRLGVIAVIGAALLLLLAAAAPIIASQVRQYVAAKGNRCKQHCPVSQGWRCEWGLRVRRPTQYDAEKCMLEMFESIPQLGAVHAVRERLALKMAHPTKQASFLFVGDNGVGKTRLAYLMSQIISACPGAAREGQPHGDSMMEIDSSSFAAVGPVKTREMLIPDLVAHVRKYPTGMIVVNDVQLFGNSIDVLSPLLTGGYFPEHSDASFAQIVLVMTMDMDTAGATEHMTVGQIKAAAEERFLRLPFAMGKLIVARADIVPFLPFDADAHRTVIKAGLMQLPCRHEKVTELIFTDYELEVLLQQIQPEDYGNGRTSAAIVDKVYNSISRTLMAAAASSGAQVPPENLKPAKFRLQQDVNGDIVPIITREESA